VPERRSISQMISGMPRSPEKTFEQARQIAEGLRYRCASGDGVADRFAADPRLPRRIPCVYDLIREVPWGPSSTEDDRGSCLPRRASRIAADRQRT